MTEAELKKLKGYYHSLSGYMQVLERIRKPYVSNSSFRPLAYEIYRIQADFPGLLSPFAETEYIPHTVRLEQQLRLSSMNETVYDVIGLQGYLALALGNLQGALDTSKGTPVTEKREFLFVSDGNLRKIIGRDYIELQRAYITECWKSVIILAGGTIEAILLDLLQQTGNQNAAMATSKAPKNKTDMTKWDLSELINVAVELQLVSHSVEKLSHSVREYRNLIHPGVEIRNKLKFDTEEARIALEVLHIVHRELS